MLFEYDTLKVIWWLFVGVLLIGFAVTDGFDLGIGALLPFVGKTDDERRIIINSIGAHWEGNQVWFVTAGGATFAAWPIVYATAFSGMYWALMLVLFALFFRPVGFKYRSKLHDPRWRNTWDWLLFVGGSVPALVFGIAFGNLLLGVPFDFNRDLMVKYSGSFFGLLNPFALLSGVLSVCMLVMHGAVYLQLKTGGEVAVRAKHAALLFAILTMAAFALAGVWLATGIEGYRIVSMPAPHEVITPLDKVVERAPGAWLRELRDAPLDDVCARARLCGRRRDDPSDFAEPQRHGARGERSLGGGHHSDGGLFHVPVRDAVLIVAECEPHDLGLGVESPHAQHHVLRRRPAPAHRDALHGLGLSRHARQDHRRIPARERTRHVLRRRIMWYFTWILGVGLALAFGIINVMWLEAEGLDEEAAERKRRD